MFNHEFKLRPSLLYAFVLLLFIIGSLIITLLLPVSGWLRWPLLLILFLYGMHLMQQHALLTSPDSVLGFKKLDESRWQIITRRAVYEGKLLGDSVVSGIVSVLRFSVQGRRTPLSCVVWRNSLPSEDYRKMMTLVKHG
jgi:hypothetical protein